MIKQFFIENLLDKWKVLAREMNVNESDIHRISKESLSLKEKFSKVDTCLTICLNYRITSN